VTDPDRPMMNNDDHQEARLRFILNGLANEVWLDVSAHLVSYESSVTNCPARLFDALAPRK
jgi:hypothetical protein